MTTPARFCLLGSLACVRAGVEQTLATESLICVTASTAGTAGPGCQREGNGACPAAAYKVSF